MLILIIANVLSFYLGGYHSLIPVLYVSGLVLASAVGILFSMKMKTKDLILLLIVTIFLAYIDEYAHTMANFFTYYDQIKPSPLTVFGWTLFIPVNLTIAQYLYNKFPMDNLIRGIRVAPTMLSVILLIIFSWAQGYILFLTWFLAIIYTMLILVSFYYTNQHSVGWNVWVMVTSLATSILMESIGLMEGMWTYNLSKSMPFFMLFVWTLRIWTIFGLSYLLGIQIPKRA
jgi:hypothetical protein